MLKKGSKTKYFIVATLFFYIILCSISLSQSIGEIKDKIEQATDSQKQLEKEIASYEAQLKTINGQADSLANAIKILDTTIKKNSTDIKLTQNNIKKTELEIDKLSLNIDRSVDVIDQNSKVIAEMISQTNKADTSTFIENLLVYDDFSQFLNEVESLYKIQNKIREKVDETKVAKKGLEIDKDDAIIERKKLLSYKAELEDKKVILEMNKKEKNQLLVSTKNQESNYKSMLAITKAKQEALEKEISNYESQLSSIVDIKSFPSPKRGILSWPLFNVYITQKFGYTDFSKTAYTGGQHTGVDFGTSIGTNVKASLDGIVEGTGNTDVACPGASFGNWILIKHNNGLSTLYGHLSLIKVKKGDKVSTGSLIGYSGNTGFSTGPHLHFGLYATEGVSVDVYKFNSCYGASVKMPVLTKKESRLDPLKYLPTI
ncbi:MAG: peptidoglycan DD-metalloendopeptidase family protein [Candidatus Paceibacterota bacterium]|jgi:murein DD-endopeptidase MepM/ murein hydrolase activator NlpD